METDSARLHDLIQEIDNIYAQDMGNTSKVFYIMKEIGKLKAQMRIGISIEDSTELANLRILRTEIEKTLEWSTDPNYAPKQLEKIYHLISASY